MYATNITPLIKRLQIWFNEYMTIVLVALGSSLFLVMMFLLEKATDPTVINGTCWYILASISVVLALGVYGIALMREWKREKEQEQREKEREQREIVRFEEEKKLFTNVTLIGLDKDKPK